MKYIFQMEYIKSMALIFSVMFLFFLVLFGDPLMQMTGLFKDAKRRDIAQTGVVVFWFILAAIAAILSMRRANWL